ncbi:MAG: YcfL family protein [Desulfovibrio sp.]|jgi:uncharacterized protein YcfL|nr:YcfL family protein [Desulfovibrio sp.]
MSRISLFSLIVLCVLLLAGCGRSTHIYADNKDVEVDSITHIQDGEFLVVSAVLVSSDNDDATHSVYRMLWFDADGLLLEQTSWRPVVVKGGAPVHIRERSTIPGAAEYTLLISNDAS